jgi:hypothetical protein
MALIAAIAAGSVSRAARAQVEPATTTGPPAAPSAEPLPAPTATDPPATNPIPLATDVRETTTPRAVALEQRKPPRRFAGTQLFQQLSSSTATFVGGQQTYNPTVEAATFILPRYAFDDWQLRARLVFNYELTNSDATTTKNEPRFSDTTLQLFYRKLPTVVGFQPLIGAQLVAPTSPESRARTMLFSPGLVAQVSRPIAHVCGGELLVLGTLTYQHPIYRYTTPELRGDWPYRFSCHGGGTGCDGQLGGITNASDIATWSLLLAGEWGKWSPALFVLGTHQFAYAPTEIAGLSAAAGSGVRQSTYFSAWIDYNANAWLTAELGYFMFRNVLSGDGQYGNPFFDRYQDARVYAGVNINIDTLVKELVERDSDEEGGIIRAKNRFAPSNGVF